MDILTGFEQRVANDEYPEWTSLQEEAIYLDSLADLTDRMAYEVVGASVKGNPIRLIRVGHPTAPSPRRARQGPTVLLVAQQHGWEVAGREASLKFIRDLVFSEDHVRNAYLSEVTWLIMPTSNPDSLGDYNTGDRLNANGVDLNRNHIAVTEPEVQAIHRVVRDYRPHIIIDAHEARDAGRDFEYYWSMHPNASPDINKMSRELVEGRIVNRLVSEGYTHQPYQALANMEYHPPYYFMFFGGLTGAISILLESRRSNTPNQHPRPRRVKGHCVCFEEILAFDIENRSRIQSVVTNARLAQRNEGLYSSRPFSFGSRVLENPPAGYYLSSTQFDSIKQRLNDDGISWFAVDSGYYVPMGQDKKPIIPHLLDQDSPLKRATGQRASARPKAVNVHDVFGWTEAPIRHNIGGQWMMLS